MNEPEAMQSVETARALVQRRGIKPLRLVEVALLIGARRAA
jgi:hypothetical protein